MRQSQSESAAISSSTSSSYGAMHKSSAAMANESIQLGPVVEEDHQQQIGSSETVIGGGTEMSKAIMDMVRPAISRLDEQVKNTRKSQIYLATHIDQLSAKLKSVVDEQTLPYDLDIYVRKLDDSRKRIINVNQRLQSLHGRMSQLQRNIAREVYKQRQQPTHQ